jgi:hypothetical protein
MDLREKVAFLCQDRGSKPYKHGYIYVMDPTKRLNIYFMNAKTRKNGMIEMLFLDVVIKEEYTSGKWEEIARVEFNSPMNCLKYNVDKLLDDIEERFLLGATQSKEQQALRKEFEKIAQKYLFIDTLKTQNSDSLDFHDVSVWGVEAALQAAYELGRNSKK